METIGNQEYYEFDTVFCVSSQGVEYRGFFYELGNSSYIKIINNGTKYEFQFYKVNPIRMVLIEKEYKIDKTEYEYVTYKKISMFINK